MTIFKASRAVLPFSSTAAKANGLLEFQETSQLSLSTGRVTLSACDTANGKLEGEEGIDGQAGAFLLAGAKSVVGALWNVDDSETRSLMKNFYLYLAQGQDKASALQQAKLDSFGDPDLAQQPRSFEGPIMQLLVAAGRSAVARGVHLHL